VWPNHKGKLLPGHPSGTLIGVYRTVFKIALTLRILIAEASRPHGKLCSHHKANVVRIPSLMVTGEIA
jgi:hypothetical protein